MNGTIFFGTWTDGVFVRKENRTTHELAGQSVRGLTDDGEGGVLAIADNHNLVQRVDDGQWSKLASATSELSVPHVVNGTVLVGTDDARILRYTDAGELVEFESFESVPGRDSWFAGSAVINGQTVGPPLGVRSMASVGADVLLVNVHVGGIPRSEDGGASWHPTIDINNDVHEVVAHPTEEQLVVAAAATGYCRSTDCGKSWTVDSTDLHAAYCSAIVCLADTIFIAASEHHFAAGSVVYRRSVRGDADSFTPLGSGFPATTDGIVDTGCIAHRSNVVAIGDKCGHLYVSDDAGNSWITVLDGLPAPSDLLVVADKA